MATLDLHKLLHTILLRSPKNLFDEFIVECQKWYETPAHTLTEMRTRNNKKIRGDIFEMFCVLYLLHVNQYNQVWRLEDVPIEILEKLKLKRRDMGIDIIVEHESKYYAVQCKYKKHTSFRKNIVTWKGLSTFYAMCLRTGPWDKYIVMTNCEGIKHEGVRTAKDISLCIGTFRNISSEEWVRMCEIEGHKISETNEIIPETNTNVTEEDIRKLRVAYFKKTF
jgi:predicted helicase